MEKAEKKQFKDIKDSELERIEDKKEELDKEIEQLKADGYSDDEIAIMLTKEDSKELIEREGAIEGEEDRARAKRQNKEKEE